MTKLKSRQQTTPHDGPILLPARQKCNQHGNL